MFQWVEINLENHPRFKRTTPTPAVGPATNTVALIQELFDYFLKNRLLILPAAMFATYVEGTPNGPEGNIHDRCQYFRATFAGETSQIEVACVAFPPMRLVLSSTADRVPSEPAGSRSLVVASRSGSRRATYPTAASSPTSQAAFARPPPPPQSLLLCFPPGLFICCHLFT
jgi:hypothetical protein